MTVSVRYSSVSMSEEWLDFVSWMKAVATKRLGTTPCMPSTLSTFSCVCRRPIFQ